MPGAVGQREIERRRLDRGLLEDRERLERLGEVAGVQVDQVVGADDKRGEQVVGEHLGEGAVRITGEVRFRFLPSAGTMNGVLAQNPGTFATGTGMIRPETAPASSRTNSRTAAIEVYSAP